MAQAAATTNTKEAHINLRARAQDKALIERAAALRGMKVSSFILTDAIKHAKRVLEDAGVMILDDDDRQAFVNAFLEPHEATPYMKRAIKAHQQD
ncbi:MAG: hypothetical protein COB49_07290 [Alphaproteobacteria bacterium]|nr:MAG: hypothetical protein COB49_07290 [Alphaproteobacteria bacterium]